MRSKSETVRLPFPLLNALKEVCQRHGFKHMHACIIGACYMLVQVDKMLGRISHISNAKTKDQDLMLKILLAFPQDEKGMIRELRKLDKT